MVTATPSAVIPAQAPTVAASEPAMDTTTQTTTHEGLLETLIATNMLGDTTSSGIPDLIFQVSCNQVEHKVTADMTKGFFIIKGNEFISKSVMQVNDMSEERITHKG